MISVTEDSLFALLIATSSVIGAYVGLTDYDNNMSKYMLHIGVVYLLLIGFVISITTDVIFSHQIHVLIYGTCAVYLGFNCVYNMTSFVRTKSQKPTLSDLFLKAV